MNAMYMLTRHTHYASEALYLGTMLYQAVKTREELL